MTPQDRLVTMKEGATLDEAQALMHKHRLERVLIVNDAFELRGLATVKDIVKNTEHPYACKDSQGQLRVGAAVGVGAGTEERVEKLVAAGVDVIIVDTAHGHSAGVLERVRWVKQNYPRSKSSAAISPPPPPRARWSKPAPTASRSVSARLHLHHAHRGRCGRAPDQRHLRRGQGPRRHRRAPSSPTAASATRATSPRRWPPARSPA